MLAPGRGGRPVCLCAAGSERAPSVPPGPPGPAPSHCPRSPPWPSGVQTPLGAVRFPFPDLVTHLLPIKFLLPCVFLIFTLPHSTEL